MHQITQSACLKHTLLGSTSELQIHKVWDGLENWHLCQVPRWCGCRPQPKDHHEIMPFAATWVQLEMIILSEVSQKEKDKYHMISLIYVESKIWYKWTYLWNRNRITDIENRLVVANREGVGGGMEWEIGVSRCKPLYIEWINNKVLLYSTENYTQYPMINHNGKEDKKRMYICITNHSAVQQ